MLYAHWEGYTKNALSYYWKYVARKRLAYKDLALNFVALGIERELSRLQAINQTERQMARVRRMAECNDDRALMTDREIDTQANLNSDVLSELFAKLGLDVVQFATKQPFIDFSLLRARNSIAHGEYLDVSAESYSEAHHEVLGLLAAVRNAVSNSAALGTFRR